MSFSKKRKRECVYQAKTKGEAPLQKKKMSCIHVEALDRQFTEWRINSDCRTAVPPGKYFGGLLENIDVFDPQASRIATVWPGIQYGFLRLNGTATPTPSWKSFVKNLTEIVLTRRPNDKITVSSPWENSKVVISVSHLYCLFYKLFAQLGWLVDYPMTVDELRRQLSTSVPEAYDVSALQPITLGSCELAPLSLPQFIALQIFPLWGNTPAQRTALTLKFDAAMVEDVTCTRCYARTVGQPDQPYTRKDLKVEEWMKADPCAVADLLKAKQVETPRCSVLDLLREGADPSKNPPFANILKLLDELSPPLYPEEHQSVVMRCVEQCTTFANLQDLERRARTIPHVQLQNIVAQEVLLKMIPLIQNDAQRVSDYMNVCRFWRIQMEEVADKNQRIRELQVRNVELTASCVQFQQQLRTANDRNGKLTADNRNLAATLESTGQSLLEFKLQQSQAEYENTIRSRDPLEFYDGVFFIENMSDIFRGEKGWAVKSREESSGLDYFTDERLSTTCSIFGAFNTGKSYISMKLSMKDFPCGTLLHTRGISIIRVLLPNGKEVVLLDTQGRDSPIVDMILPECGTITTPLMEAKYQEQIYRETCFRISNIPIFVTNRCSLPDHDHILELEKALDEGKNARVIVFHNLKELSLQQMKAEGYIAKIKTQFQLNEQVHIVDEKNVNSDITELFKHCRAGVIQHFFLTGSFWENKNDHVFQFVRTIFATHTSVKQCLATEMEKAFTQEQEGIFMMPHQQAKNHPIRFIPDRKAFFSALSGEVGEGPKLRPIQTGIFTPYSSRSLHDNTPSHVLRVYGHLQRGGKRRDQELHVITFPIPGLNWDAVYKPQMNFSENCTEGNPLVREMKDGVGHRIINVQFKGDRAILPASLLNDKDPHSICEVSRARDDSLYCCTGKSEHDAEATPTELEFSSSGNRSDMVFTVEIDQNFPLDISNFHIDENAPPFVAYQQGMMCITLLARKK